MRTAGQWAGRARAMADQFRRSFDDMARHRELEELRTEVDKLRSEATKPMTDLDYKSYGRISQRSACPRNRGRGRGAAEIR